MTRKTALKTLALLAAGCGGERALVANPEERPPAVPLRAWPQMKLAITFATEAYTDIVIRHKGQTKRVDFQTLFDAL
jgi:hypothetical protein